MSSGSMGEHTKIVSPESRYKKQQVETLRVSQDQKSRAKQEPINHNLKSLNSMEASDLKRYALHLMRDLFRLLSTDLNSVEKKQLNTYLQDFFSTTQGGEAGKDQIG